MATAKKRRRLQSSSKSENVGPGGKPIEENQQEEESFESHRQGQYYNDIFVNHPVKYIGSLEKHSQALYVYEAGEMVNRTVSYVPGLYKIFNETLERAAYMMMQNDHPSSSSMNALSVDIDEKLNRISVYVNGVVYPVKFDINTNYYIPEKILTFEINKGYGLTNVFSTEFVYETADGENRRKFKQVFMDNSRKKFEPFIETCEGENWTRVTFKPDLSKFNMTHLEEDVIAMMKKRVFDFAGCLGSTVKVSLNGEQLPINSFFDYVDLYLNSASKTRLVPLPRLTEIVNKRLQVCVSMSEGHFQQVSLVNTVCTIKGGTHVDYVTNQITNHVNKLINKNKKANLLNVDTVKNHLWVFVNALIPSAGFDSQTKETLMNAPTSFGMKHKLSQEFLKKVSDSAIVERFLSSVKFQPNKELKKTDEPKKNNRIFCIPRLRDANEAGGEFSDKCTLILAGDDLVPLARAGFRQQNFGLDYYGVFQLGVPLLNVRETSHEQIMENDGIQHIIRTIGLELGKVYDNAKSLRYGHLMIMTNQNHHDGFHIKGLVINFIHFFWPSLLKIPNFLMDFIPPIVKELGSTEKKGKEYFQSLETHMRYFTWVDEEDGYAIDMAFTKKRRIGELVNWIQQFKCKTSLVHEKHIRYCDFVNKELILYFLADMKQSIPSMVDGLKPVQRKILYCAFKKDLVTEEWVSQFLGYVLSHFGDDAGFEFFESLVEAIVGMAQDFVGSNNINLFNPGGQFGTRLQGGKDHADAEDICTNLTPIARLLFPKVDDILLNYLIEDGKPIVSTWYAPVIPLVLVNGSGSIGKEWSTFVPNYNPRDLCANVRRLLRGEPMVPIHPWYKGFRGTIKETTMKDNALSYTLSGIIEPIDATKKLKIRELPVSIWTTQDFREFLQDAATGKIKEPIIEDYWQYNDADNIHFEVSMYEDNVSREMEEGNDKLLEMFKLTTTFSTSNMYLIDATGVIKKYDNPEQILEEFFHVRLQVYEKRKEMLLSNLKLERFKIESTVRFIDDVDRGEITVKNKRSADFLLDLKNKGFFTCFQNKSIDLEENEKQATSFYLELLGSIILGWCTPKEQLLSLGREKEKLTQKMEELDKCIPENMWMMDIDALDRQLEEEGYAIAEVDKKNLKGKVIMK